MSASRSLLLVLVLVATSSPVFSQLPQTRITSVFPPGGQQGTTVDVTVGGGTDLDEIDAMVFSHPGITALPRIDGNGKPIANSFSVTIDSNVPPGLYDVRVRGLFGVSNPRIFRVDTIAEIVETEPNNSQNQATSVAAGTVINARANGATDVDFYRIPVRAGQPLVVRCECARLDSPMQPVIQLLTVTGRRIAESRRVLQQEAGLVYTPTADEDVLLRVQDAVYGGGDQFIYRLSIDHRPLVDWISPSFVAAGASTPVTVYGRYLPDGEPTDLKIEGSPVAQRKMVVHAPAASVPVGAAALSAFGDSFWWNEIDGNLIRIGQSPESATAAANESSASVIALPSEISGSFSVRSQEDSWTFEGKKGDSWVIEVFSQRQGSIADPLLMVERVITAADGAVTYNRLATEDDDRQNPGGADLPTLGDDPSFRLDVPEDGTYRIRLKDRYADTRGDPRLTYRLSIRHPKPDFRLVVFDAFPAPDGKAPATSGAVSLRKGGSYEVTVFAYRCDGHAGPIELNAVDLAPGISCRPSVIGPGQASAKLVISAASDADEKLTPIRIIGRSGQDADLIERQAGVATLVHDAINGLPRTARLSESLVAGVMKDEQPFSIHVEPIVGDFSQDQLLLIPIQVIRRGGFDGKIDLGFYGVPAEVDAPAVALEPGVSQVTAKLYLKEKAPVSVNTILVQGTSSVPYRRNPWQADRAKAGVAQAEAMLAERQKDVSAAETALKVAQDQVTVLTEQIKKLTEELAAYGVQQQKLRDEFAKAVGEQKSAVEALAKIQQQLAEIKADASSTPEQFDAAIQALTTASSSVDEAAKKVAALTVAAGEVSKLVAAAKAMEEAHNLAKAKAEEAVAARKKEAETAQTSLSAAQKNVETAMAAKTAADAALKAAEDASQPKPVNVRVVSDPLVIAVHPGPAKLTAAVPDSGNVKRSATIAVKVTVARKNSFMGPMSVQLVLPEGVSGLASDIVELPADQTECMVNITASADAVPGDVANAVIRATGDFAGRSASTDAAIALKIVE